MVDPERGLEGSLAVLSEDAPERFLRFYDRLRARIVKRLGSGRLPQRLTEVLLLAPDLFILLVRLFLDREVPQASRQLIGGALLYFVVPIDLLPEAFLGVGGLADDVVLASAVAAHIFSSDLRPFVERHWSGTSSLEGALERVSASAQSLLGHDLHSRLLRMVDGRSGQGR